jgi:hypothetical protein
MADYTILPVLASLQTNNGDTSYEELTQGVPLVVALQDPAAIIPPGDVIEKVTVTSVHKDPEGAGDTVKAGIRCNAIDQYGGLLSLDATGYFTPMNDEFETDGAGGIWTVAKLAAASLIDLATAVAGAKPRVTQLVVTAHTHPGPAHARAAGSALAAGVAAGAAVRHEASGSIFDADEAEGEG